jgi:hypothetical protein
VLSQIRQASIYGSGTTWYGTKLPIELVGVHALSVSTFLTCCVFYLHEYDSHAAKRLILLQGTHRITIFACWSLSLHENIMTRATNYCRRSSRFSYFLEQGFRLLTSFSLPPPTLVPTPSIVGLLSIVSQQHERILRLARAFGWRHTRWMGVKHVTFPQSHWFTSLRSKRSCPKRFCHLPGTRPYPQLESIPLQFPGDRSRTLTLVKKIK